MDNRVSAAIVTTAAVVALGLLIALIPSSQMSMPQAKQPAPIESWKAPQDDEKTAKPDKKKQAIKKRFDQAVVMLHAREYRHAMTALHEVLKVTPNMPEAHVNMGYAYLGLKKHREAKDFFNTALDIRPSQINAYYGLALALYELDEYEGASGAIKTYIHRTSKDDPYMRKAQALLWELEYKWKQVNKKALKENKNSEKQGKGENAVSRERVPVNGKK